jgi:hypothetical protein
MENMERSSYTFSGHAEFQLEIGINTNKSVSKK